MGLNVSPSQNLFKFKIPKDFFPKEVKENYERYLKATESSYPSLEELVNSEVQNITIPAMSINVSTQVDSTTNSFTRDRQSGFDAYRQLDKSFSIQFRNIEGYITYLAMMETFLSRSDYMQSDKKRIIPHMSVQLLSRENVPLYRVDFNQVIFKSISQLTLDYTNPTNQNTSFTCGFHFNTLKPIFGLNPKE